LRLARQLHVPFLLTPFLHLGDPEDPRDPTRRAYTSPALVSLLQQADVVFVQTEVERDALLRLGIAPHGVILLGMGVDPAECTGGDRERARRQWGIPADEVVIGHLANNSVEKGTVDLLQAAERSWSSAARFHVVLAGPEMPNFQRFWRTFRAAPRVRRLGVLDEKQKQDFFAAIDVFALPSRSDSFGLVLLESWANNVPSVAYRAGGVAGVIRHEEDGLLVRCGDVDGLAQALVRLTSDANARHRLGQAGRERTEREFRWSDKLHRVRQVYSDLLAKMERRP
jgi:glycosyltransferase involved in cell wall biosynthesis